MLHLRQRGDRGLGLRMVFAKRFATQPHRGLCLRQRPLVGPKRALDLGGGLVQIGLYQWLAPTRGELRRLIERGAALGGGQFRNELPPGLVDAGFQQQRPWPPP